MLGRSMSLPEDAQYDVELGPLFAVGAIILAYGLLRRKAAFSRCRGWSNLARSTFRVRSHREEASQQCPEGADQGSRTARWAAILVVRQAELSSIASGRQHRLSIPSVPRVDRRGSTFVRECLRNPAAHSRRPTSAYSDSTGLAHRRTKPWARGPRGRVRAALVGASDVVESGSSRPLRRSRRGGGR